MPIIPAYPLEASYDAGALKLDGPHFSVERFDELPTRNSAGGNDNLFGVGLEWWSGASYQIYTQFRHDENQVAEIDYTELKGREWSGTATLRPNMSHEALRAIIDEALSDTVTYQIWQRLYNIVTFCVVRHGCFLAIEGNTAGSNYLIFPPLRRSVVDRLVELFHVPGIRGQPKRVYPTSRTGTAMPGLFEAYTASILYQWQHNNDHRCELVRDALRMLRLTGTVDARRRDDVSIEVLVGRLPVSTKDDPDDLVSIADVGFGVSQVLPVVVALAAAEPGQLVYIEQPELHLHPRAQQALAGLLADAARRGVRVVIETHSELLLVAIQTVVAEGKLDPALTQLHWFQRDETGATHIESTQLDERGAYGDWPEDFGTVAMRVEEEYLRAATRRNGSGKHTS